MLNLACGMKAWNGAPPSGSLFDVQPKRALHIVDITLPPGHRAPL